MFNLSQVLKRYLVPRKTKRISLDPNWKGVKVDNENRLIYWSNIKEFREDIYVGGRPTIWGDYYTLITADGEEIPINVLGESLRKMIIDKANLKNYRTDFLLSQKVFSR